MPGKPFIMPFDPDVIATRFAAPPPPDPDDDPPVEDPPEEPDREAEIDKLRPLIARLPDEDRDIFELRWVRGKTQHDIATIFRVTQAAICYRLERISARLRFLSGWAGKDLTPDDVRRDLAPYFTAEDAEILALYLMSSCQLAVGQQLGIRQEKVRHRIVMAIRLLSLQAPHHPELAIYYDAFSQLFAAKTILHLNRNQANKSLITKEI